MNDHTGWKEDMLMKVKRVLLDIDLAATIPTDDGEEIGSHMNVGREGAAREARPHVRPAQEERSLLTPVFGILAATLLGVTVDARADCTNYKFAPGRGPLTGLQGLSGGVSTIVLDPPPLAVSSDAGSVQDYPYFYQVEPSYAYVPAIPSVCTDNTQGRVVFGYIDADSRRRRAKATGVLRSTIVEWVNHESVGLRTPTISKMDPIDYDANDPRLSWSKGATVYMVSNGIKKGPAGLYDIEYNAGQFHQLPLMVSTDCGKTWKKDVGIPMDRNTTLPACPKESWWKYGDGNGGYVFNKAAPPDGGAPVSCTGPKTPAGCSKYCENENKWVFTWNGVACHCNTSGDYPVLYTDPYDYSQWVLTGGSVPTWPTDSSGNKYTGQRALFHRQATGSTTISVSYSTTWSTAGGLYSYPGDSGGMLYTTDGAMLTLPSGGKGAATGGILVLGGTEQKGNTPFLMLTADQGKTWQRILLTEKDAVVAATPNAGTSATPYNVLPAPGMPAVALSAQAPPRSFKPALFSPGPLHTAATLSVDARKPEASMLALRRGLALAPGRPDPANPTRRRLWIAHQRVNMSFYDSTKVGQLPVYLDVSEVDMTCDPTNVAQPCKDIKLFKWLRLIAGNARESVFHPYFIYADPRYNGDAVNKHDVLLVYYESTGQPGGSGPRFMAQRFALFKHSANAFRLGSISEKAWTRYTANYWDYSEPGFPTRWPLPSTTVPRSLMGFTVFANTTSQLGPGETWDGLSRTHLAARVIVPSLQTGTCASSGP